MTHLFAFKRLGYTYQEHNISSISRVSSKQLENIPRPGTHAVYHARWALATCFLAMTALSAIFNNFSLSGTRSLSLKQNYPKNRVNLYGLLLALPQAKIGEQIVDFVKGLIKRDDLSWTDTREK